MTIFHIIFFILLGRFGALLVMKEWTAAAITGLIFTGYVIWLNKTIKKNTK